MPPVRVYADASVYGGVFDVEFSESSKRFFDEVRAGRFDLVTSPLVNDELASAPEQVREFFLSWQDSVEIIDITEEMLELQSAYLSYGVVTDNSSEDALHVASATVSRCAVLVSWNFKHIVHRDKAPRCNAVNTLRGWATIGIYSPAEVVSYG
jgi:hypothetical protein